MNKTKLLHKHRFKAIWFSILIAEIIFQTGCGSNKTSSVYVNYNPSTGVVSVPGAQIISQGQVFIGGTTITAPSLVGIVKNNNVYLWFTGMGSTALNETTSIQAVIDKVFYLYTTTTLTTSTFIDNNLANNFIYNPLSQNLSILNNYPVGVNLQSAGNNSYQINNTKRRLEVFKLNYNNSCSIATFLQPIKTFNPDFIGLIANWNEVKDKIFLYTPSTNFNISDNANVEVLGSIARLAFLPPLFLQTKFVLSSNDIQAAINADPELFTEVNFVDVTDIAVDMLGDVIGAVPVIGCTKSAIESDVIEPIYQTFRTQLINTNSPATISGLASNASIGTAKSIIGCACNASVILTVPCEVARYTMEIITDIPKYGDIVVGGVDAFLSTPYETIPLTYTPSLPSPPTNLTATAGNGQVTLNWSASSGATGYNVKYGTTSGGPYPTVIYTTNTNYTVTGLTNGTPYYFVVTAVNSAGESGYSNQASATPSAPLQPPIAPTNLAAVAGNGQVSLSWSASYGATSYNIYESTTSGGPYTKINSTTNTNYTVTGLTNGATYYFVVTAVNSAGESGYSNEVGMTLIPSSPPNLTVTAGNAQANLTWNASIGSTSYNVYYSMTSGGPYTKIVSNITNTSYTVTGLANCTIYYFVVTAINNTGESGYSNEVNVMPQIVPTPPNNLTASNPINGGVTLSWGNTSACTANYNVYESTTSGGPYTRVSSAGSTNYTVTGLTNGTTYYFVVTAVDSVGESGYSNEVNAKPYIEHFFAVGSSPYAIATDALGNIWVTNYGSNSVTELGPTGSLIGTYLVGANPYGIAIDTYGSGNVWVANYGGNSVVELSPTGSLITTATVGTNPVGIALDVSGNIWVANNGSSSVTQLNSTGITIGTYSLYGYGSSCGSGPSINPPEEIAMDGYGNILVTTNSGGGQSCHPIFVLSPTGSIIAAPPNSMAQAFWITFDKYKRIVWATADLNSGHNAGYQFDINGNYIGMYTTGHSPNGAIATDNSGNIWVTNQDNTVSVLSPTGSIIGTYPVGKWPTGIAIDASGNVWVANAGSNNVTEIVGAAQGPQYFPFPLAPTNLQAVVTQVLARKGYPTQIALSWSPSAYATGYNVYTSTTSGGPYIKTAFTTTTSYLFTGVTWTVTAYFVVSAVNAIREGCYSYEVSVPVVTLPPNEYVNPVGVNPFDIAIDSSGNVWVTNYGGSTVSELTYASNYNSANTFSVGAGPLAIVIDSAGNVWVDNNRDNTISELTYASNYISENTFVVGNNSNGMAIDKSGNIWVTNANSNNVTELSSTGITIGTYDVGGISPQGIAIDASGNVWVTNGSNNGPPSYSVTKLNSSGSLIGTYSTIGSPLGIAIDPSGNVWVANNWCGSGVICYVDKENSISEFNSTGSIIGTYTVGVRPWGIAIDASGNVWVANDLSNTVSELSPTGSIIGTYPVGKWPTGIAIDASGNVWVANYGDNTVTEITGVATGPQYWPYVGPQFPGGGNW